MKDEEAVLAKREGESWGRMCKGLEGEKGRTWPVWGTERRSPHRVGSAAVLQVRDGGLSWHGGKGERQGCGLRCARAGRSC